MRKKQKEFQLGVLEMQIEQENQISPDALVFLDRAIPDTLAYTRFLNITEDERLTEALRTISYKKIFILDCLPLVNDYARTEDAVTQKKIYALLIKAYQSLGFPIVQIPVLPPEERVDFILKNV